MTHLDEVVKDFIRDHADLFAYCWKREDEATDQELDIISDAWYDDYDDDIPWLEAGERILTLANEFDWSSQQQEQADDYHYAESDYLFDSQREERLFNRGVLRGSTWIKN